MRRRQQKEALLTVTTVSSDSLFVNFFFKIETSDFSGDKSSGKHLSLEFRFFLVQSGRNTITQTNQKSWVEFTRKDREPRIFIPRNALFSSFHSPFTKRTGLLAPWKHKFLRTRRAFSCSCLFWAPLSSNNTSTAPGVLTTPCWPSVKNVTPTSTLSQHRVTPRVIDLCLGWALLFRGFNEEKDWRKFVYRVR